MLRESFLEAAAPLSPVYVQCVLEKAVMEDLNVHEKKERDDSSSLALLSRSRKFKKVFLK